MADTERFSNRSDAQAKVPLVARELNLNIIFSQQTQLVNTTAGPCVKDITSPHESSSALSGDNGRCGAIRLGAQDIGRVLGVNFQGVGHTNGQTAEDQGLVILASSKVIVL